MSAKFDSEVRAALALIRGTPTVGRPPGDIEVMTPRDTEVVSPTGEVEVAQKKCSSCGALGHNSRSCKAPRPAAPQTQKKAPSVRVTRAPAAARSTALEELKLRREKLLRDAESLGVAIAVLEGTR